MGGMVDEEGYGAGNKGALFSTLYSPHVLAHRLLPLVDDSSLLLALLTDPVDHVTH